MKNCPTFSLTQNRLLAPLLVSFVLLIMSCTKERSSIRDIDNYSSLDDFYQKNALPLFNFQVTGSEGGTFTTPQGTRLSIAANSFVDPSGNVITGKLDIVFLDLYKKSEMLFSGISTATNGWPLKSGGEFFIKASANGKAVKIFPGKSIVINQPANDIDTLMSPFVGLRDSINMVNWVPMDSSNVVPAPDLQSYIFSLYTFSSPLENGTWCNSDNAVFFSNFNTTALTIVADDDPDAFETNVFLIFPDVNSMIHVYKNWNDNLFPYAYAPIGFDCSIVAIGVKDGKFYSSFTPLTIKENQTVHFSLAKTNTETFKQQLELLNN